MERTPDGMDAREGEGGKVVYGGMYVNLAMYVVESLRERETGHVWNMLRCYYFFCWFSAMLALGFRCFTYFPLSLSIWLS
jgi:hypothetical protein